MSPYQQDPYANYNESAGDLRPLTTPSYVPKWPAAGSAPGAPPAAAGLPAPQAAIPTEEALANYGYTGPMGINNVEQQALDFIQELYSTGGGLETMGGAQDYYRQILEGKFGPESAAYLQSVLDPMRSSMQQDYRDMSKRLASQFSNVGAFYGGKSGVAQGRLASESANKMAQTEAGLRYQAFMDDMQRRSGAAGGLINLGTAQSEASGDMLSYILTGGNLISDRDKYNRSEYQNAYQRAYNDWIRARSEALGMFDQGQGLLGQQATTPVVSQGTDWGAIIGDVSRLAASAISAGAFG